MSRIISLKIKRNGKIDSKGPLEKGKFQGFHENYYLNGLKSSEGNYNQGEKTGIWYYYYKSGNLSSICTYKDGIREGQREKYYSSTKPVLEKREFYHKNKLHGPWSRYYDSSENGHLMVRGRYNLGDMDGCWKRFDEFGILREVEFYKKGQQVGEWQFYNEKGILLKTEIH